MSGRKWLPWGIGSSPPSLEVSKLGLNKLLTGMLRNRIRYGTENPSFVELLLKGHPITLVTIFVNSTLE